MIATRSTDSRRRVVFGAWLVAIQPKTKLVLIFEEGYQAFSRCSAPRARGPDWARTSDPALIKRML